MNEYMKVICGKLYYHDTPIAFVDEDSKTLTADTIFRTKELDSLLQTEWTVRWVENVFPELIRQPTDTTPPTKSVRLWFLNEEVDSSLKFLPYEQFHLLGGDNLTIQEYHCVFTGELPTNDLEDIFSAFQLGRVQNYSGRKLAMGDLIELYDHAERQFYYIDKVGFRELIPPKGKEVDYE